MILKTGSSVCTEMTVPAISLCIASYTEKVKNVSQMVPFGMKMNIEAKRGFKKYMIWHLKQRAGSWVLLLFLYLLVT